MPDDVFVLNGIGKTTYFRFNTIGGESLDVF